MLLLIVVGLTANTPLGSSSVREMLPVSARPVTVNVLLMLEFTGVAPQLRFSVETSMVGSVMAPFMYQKLAVPSPLMTISVTGLPR